MYKFVKVYDIKEFGEELKLIEKICGIEVSYMEDVDNGY